MKLKALTRAAAVVTAVTATAALGALPAQAATIGIPWRPTVLTMPSGGGAGFLTGSDGKGEYSGTFTVNGVTQVVSWRGYGGMPVVHALPAGYEGAKAEDENSAGTIVGTSDDWDTMISRTFTLDATGYHIKDVPAGYDRVEGAAINTRGDVLGRAYKFTGNDSAAVLWRASGGDPVVIPQMTDHYYARDLDDDGSILFEGGSAPTLWKDGVFRQLPEGSFGQVIPYAIRNGVIVGESPTARTAIRWNTPTSDPVELAGGAMAIDVSKAGLSVGYVPNSTPESTVGNSIAWRGTTPGTLLPASGHQYFRAQVAADDGSFAGYAADALSSYGGVPVIWRKSAT